MTTNLKTFTGCYNGKDKLMGAFTSFNKYYLAVREYYKNSNEAFRGKSTIKSFTGETGNDKEIKMANENPETILISNI